MDLGLQDKVAIITGDGGACWLHSTQRDYDSVPRSVAFIGREKSVKLSTRTTRIWSETKLLARVVLYKVVK